MKFQKIFLEGRKPYNWIVGVALLVYLKSIFFGLSYLDDNVLILDHQYFLKSFNIVQAFTRDVFLSYNAQAYYRPIMTLSLMWDALFFGSNPFFYHLSNVLIHIITACLVYAFFNQLNYKKELSFIFGLIFSIHPVLAQAVAWIPGRNDSLMALFVLASFIFFLKYEREKKKKQLFWHIAFFGLAVFTKESALLLPPIILLYIILFKERNWKQYGKLFFYWILTIAVWFGLREMAFGTHSIQYSLEYVIKSLFENTPAVLLYIGKILIPVNLSVFPTLQDSNLTLGIISTIALIFLLLVSKGKDYKKILFGLAIFILFLTSSFIRPDTRYVADFLEHRVYLPFIGFLIIVGEISFVKKIAEKSWLVVIGLFISAILIFINFRYLNNFKDRLSFWTDAVKASPHHPMVRKNLGAMYYLDGNDDKALVEYKKSLELNPNETMVHNNLGLIYMNKKDFTDAEKEFKNELEINPNYDNAYFNYGLLLYNTKRYDEAEKAWLKTLEINPDYLDAYKALAVLYNQEGKIDKANLYYQEALKKERGL